jgi:hypothetical protein
MNAMNLRNIVALCAFLVPVAMAVLVVVSYALDAADAVVAVLGSLAGVSFGWPGRIIAALFKTKDDGE